MPPMKEIQRAFQADYYHFEQLQKAYIQEIIRIRQSLEDLSESETYDEIILPIQMVLSQLRLQEEVIKAMNRDFPLLAEKVSHSLEHFGICEFCNEVFPDTSLRNLPESLGKKIICDGCYEDNFFDCHKCKRILPMSEIGQDDNNAGYGWICKDCIKPMGFPQEVVVAPDFHGCEEVAAASLDALCKYALNFTGWMEPDYSDIIDLKFVRFKDGYFKQYAIYQSDSGLKCEVGELDWRGIGSLYIYEEQSDIDDA